MSFFADNFWGEKNNGFDVVYHNMKHGQISVKEMVEYLRESASVQELNSKSWNKLAKQAANSSQQGTFSPVWQIIRMMNEKMASVYSELVHRLQEVAKELQKYGEEQKNKHKSVKEEVQPTADVVTSFQSTTAAVLKAKENYNTRCLEYERLKREGASPKEVEKAEAKFTKAKEDYTQLVQKYENTRLDFNKKMTDSTNQFQEIEEIHLSYMFDIIAKYAQCFHHAHFTIMQIEEDFKRQSEDLGIQKLIQNFAEGKGTGTEKPAVIEFEECDLSSLPPAISMESVENNGKEMPVVEKAVEKLTKKKESFLKSKKKKDKKKKKKEQTDNVSTGSPDREDGEVVPPDILVDEEGYRIKPSEEPQNAKRKDSFYSSSDEDSDDEGVSGKFRVEIKPPVVKDRHATAGDSLEELKATVGGLTLSPSPAASVKLRKEASRQQLQRSRSESQSQEDVFTYFDSMSTAGLGTSTLNSNSKPSNDLLGLDLFSSPLGTAPPISAASFSQSHSASASPEPWGLGSPTSELPPALPAKQRQLTPSTLPVQPSVTPPPGAGDASSVLPDQEKVPRPPLPGAQPVLPLPPKTARAKPLPAPRQQPSPDDMIPGHVSPPIHVTSAAPLARAESLSSISSGTFSTAGTPTAGTSRGPSPLPAGSGTETVIPVAAAFSETVNAFFKGTDQDKCMVKITGDLMMSFPHGIISALTTNPTLTPLTFRIKNSSRLEQVLPNKTLITLDPTQSQLDAQAYTFNMPALLMYLKQQADQNIGASYYNIGIMKYQMKTPAGIQNTPLTLVAYWKCEPLSTEIRIDYAYNEPAFPLATALTNVTIHLPVDGGVTNVQSIPNATWNAEAKRALWKIPEISKASEGGGISTLRAKFDLSEGPSKPMTMAVKFNSEGTTLSGLELELVGAAYRASLVKKRFAAGKYMCDSL
ncbi:FCHO1 [Branchiostoma lanceolatum]|uniref:FCHO1 protein n=1 Tax=Branchiostoma lanceolatum TaxID=7740 RepID=A0A8J9YXI9_BRALA|nr:FCHO1 [Branchiostoma lanceolatum]